jgi:hypothetical protein
VGQEPLELGRLGAQQLLAQVVEHVPVAAREARHQRLQVPSAAERHAGQVQASGPAFGALMQHGHVASVQGQPEPLVQQRGRLFEGEARSAAPSSASWPRARSRASGMGGWIQVATTKCRVAGRRSMNKASSSWQSGLVTAW